MSPTFPVGSVIFTVIFLWLRITHKIVDTTEKKVNTNSVFFEAINDFTTGYFPQDKRVAFGTKYVLASYLTPRIVLTAIKIAKFNTKVL